MQPEHQEHLGRPAAESFDRGQPFDHQLIVERIQFLEDEPAIGDPGTQVSQVADLLAAERGDLPARGALEGGRAGDDGEPALPRRLLLHLLAGLLHPLDLGLKLFRSRLLALTSSQPRELGIPVFPHELLGFLGPGSVLELEPGRQQ